jgi:hypothetical protein
MTTQQPTEETLVNQNYFARLRLKIPKNPAEITQVFLGLADKNYKNLMLQYHSDHNKDKSAEKIVRALVEAHSLINSYSDLNEIWKYAQSLNVKESKHRVTSVPSEDIFSFDKRHKAEEEKIRRETGRNFFNPVDDASAIALCKSEAIKTKTLEFWLSIAKEFPNTAEHILSNPRLSFREEDLGDLFGIGLQHPNAMENLRGSSLDLCLLVLARN